MKKLITPTVLILCPMIFLAGCATQNIAPVASNGGISVKEPGISNRAKVISRLEEVGYSKEEAIARVDKLTDSEIDYFASHPESIKRTGFIIIASLIGSSIYSTVKSSQKKKAAEIQKIRDQIPPIEREMSAKKHEQDIALILMQNEQDPAKRQALETKVSVRGNEIKSLEEKIHLLENEIQEKTNPKKKQAPKTTVPKK